MLVQFILYVLCISARHHIIVNPKYSHCGKRTLVSSADDERGAPPMVAGHIDGLWDLCLTTGVA